MKNPKRRRGRKKLPDIDISSVRDPEERRRLTKCVGIAGACSRPVDQRLKLT